MTVTTDLQSVVHDTDGVSTVFAVPFKFIENSYLVVDKVTKSNGASETLIYGTDYTASGAGADTGGTITTTNVYATGFQLHIYRSVPETQETVFTENSTFPSQSVETALDKLTMIDQQHGATLKNAIRYPLSEFDSDGVLPAANDRANKVLGFDSAGTQTLLPLPASVGAGDLTNELWKDGVDYTAGTSTFVTLSRSYTSKANLGTLAISGVAQAPDTYRLNAPLNHVEFLDDAGNPTPIPVGADKIYCIGGTTLSLNAPATGSVTDASIATGTKLYARLTADVYSTDYGAAIDGVTDARFKLLLADAAALANGGELVFVPGNYYLGANTTFTAPVRIMKGATFTRATGVTITFSNEFDAGVQKIFNFTDSGVVVFAPEKTRIGYAEWWGAVPNDPFADCAAAINASIVACSVTQLMGADYYIASAVRHNTPHHTLRGCGQDFDTLPGVTRILIKGGTLTAVIMGPNSEPAGGINAYTQGIRIEDLCIGRTLAPVIASNPWGLANRWTLFAIVKNVMSSEHIQGFYMGSVVYCKYKDCRAFRSVAGTGSGTDTFIGFNCDGSLGNGNASLYLDYCNAGLGGTAVPRANTVGFVLGGAYNDNFLTRPESSTVGYGIQFNGTGSSTLNYGGVDCQITNPILDQCAVAGINFNNTTKYGTISIIGGYTALDGSSTNQAALIFNNSLSSVKIKEFQCIMGTSKSGTPGISALNSSRIDSNSVIKECSGNAIQLTTVSSSRFVDQIQNDTIAGLASGAVYGSGVSRCYFQNMIDGGAGAWAVGYNMTGAANNYNTWECTGLNSGAVSVKLILNGVTITGQGIPASNGTDYVTGVMV